ncbi:MAG: hypothetical protein N2321_01380 [Melioribacteraceae bacterium]|nr:hypothetical protein [Melioribacteraceae bacterium]
MVKYFRLLFLLILITKSIYSQSISVTAFTDTTEYKVGDYITFSLQINHDKKIKTELPNIKDSLKVLEFIKLYPVDKKEENEKIIELHKFIFSKYDSGKVEIPSLKIFYYENNVSEKKVIATTPFTILVKTLEVNPQEDIREIKEPIKIPLPWWVIALIIISVTILFVAIYLLVKYLKKKKIKDEIKAPEIILQPHEIAIQKLDLLKEKKLWQNGNVKEYHSELTEIIREYFENRFKFRALEMPSSEILPILSIIDEAKDIFTIAENFFSNADLVKFAKYEPIPKLNEEMLSQAYEIVNKTIPIIKLEEQKNGEQNV